MYKTIYTLLLAIVLFYYGWVGNAYEPIAQPDISHLDTLYEDCKSMSPLLADYIAIKYQSCDYYKAFRTRDRFFIQCYLAPVILDDDMTSDTVIYYCPPDKEMTTPRGEIIHRYPSGLTLHKLP